MEFISINNCYKVYDNGVTALADGNLKIEKGEFVFLIGPTASGKSTILKIITGVLSPASGDVQINGRISALLELGAGFNMEYTGLENVYLNGAILGMTKAEIDAKMEAIIEFSEVRDFIDIDSPYFSFDKFM